MSVQIQNDEVLDFVEYVNAFYNPVDGVFPIHGASVEVITKGIKSYIGSLNEAVSWGGGDSVDRERVRDIILQFEGVFIEEGK